MESTLKQIRTRTGRFVLPNPRRGKNVNILRPAAFRLRNRKSEKGLIRVVRTLPCPEVIEERNRMAGEIHDTLAQQFAGILLHLEAAKGLGGAVNASACLAKARELAKCGLEDARRMLLGLRPKSLEGAHLSDALSQLAERFSRDCGINCTFGASGQPHQLSEELENELYRVAQEALCNVRKHSRAGSVSILLSYRAGAVVLAIKDNGQGFAMKQPQAGANGFGLPTMCERANRLGGKMDINTGLGTGTEIRLSVPLSAKTDRSPEGTTKYQLRAERVREHRPGWLPPNVLSLFPG